MRERLNGDPVGTDSVSLGVTRTIVAAGSVRVRLCGSTPAN